MFGPTRILLGQLTDHGVLKNSVDKQPSKILLGSYISRHFLIGKERNQTWANVLQIMVLTKEYKPVNRSWLLKSKTLSLWGRPCNVAVDIYPASSSMPSPKWLVTIFRVTVILERLMPRLSCWCYAVALNLQESPYLKYHFGPLVSEFYRPGKSWSLR